MEKRLNGFIEYDGERTDLDGCKKIIAVLIGDDKSKVIEHGDLDLIEKAGTIFALIKMIEKTTESTPGLREATKLVEVLYNETQD